MPQVLGRPGKPQTEEQRKRSAESLVKARDAQIRFRGGRMASAADVKAALEGSVAGYLALIESIALEAEDPRVALDAAKYLVDRVAGKPTEKVQMDTTPVTFTAPTDAQMTALAKTVRGEDETSSETAQTIEQPEVVN